MKAVQVDRSDRGASTEVVTADIQAKAITLAKVMSIEELEALQAKLIKAQEEQRKQLLEAPAVDLNPKKPN